MNKRVNTLKIEGAQIIFRNFSGTADDFNREGSRQFGVIIPPELVDGMMADGWNLKQLRPRDEEEEAPFYLNVSVNYSSGFPPSIYKITKYPSGDRPPRKIFLTEDTVGALDAADIIMCDLILSPYYWEVANKSGIKAYLKSMYVTVEADEFEEKYAGFDE